MAPPNQDEEPKFFDVRKSAGPPPTTRPIIVGHHPTMPDPMLQRPLPTTQPAEQPAPAPTPEPVPTPRPDVPPAGSELNPQPVAEAPNIPEPAQPLSEDMKVKLPAGEAARAKNSVWVVLVLVIAAVTGVIFYLFIK